MTSPTTPQDKRICIGKIAGAHGVKGLVKITPYCDDLSLLNGDVFIDETGSQTITITLKNPAGKHIVAEIKGMTSRNDAEKTKHMIYIARGDLPEIDDDGEFYVEDLKNMSAKNTQGEIIGKVLDVQNFGAGDLLEIKPLSGASYFIPFQDEFVTDIDFEGASLTLENPEHFIID